MTLFHYVGPHDVVEMDLPNGGHVYVERGQGVELDLSQAAIDNLLAQGTWVLGPDPLLVASQGDSGASEEG